MLKTISRFFASPIFPGDEEKTRVARLLNPILSVLLVVITASLPGILASTTPENVTPFLLMVAPLLAIDAAAYALMRKGRVRLASILTVASLGIAIFGAYAVSSYQSVGAALSFFLLIAIAMLLLDARAVTWLTIIVIVFTLVMATLQANDVVKPLFTTYADPIGQWVSTAIVYFLVGIMLVLSTTSLQRALQNARSAAQELQESNRVLKELGANLEHRIEERTAELAAATATSQRRARQFETIARVSSEITSAQNLDELLPRIAETISEQFGFYHAGIFFNDAPGLYAVLSAANSPGGKKMLARGHKLKVGEQGIVGYVTGSGLPRVVQNVGQDSVYFNNPDLPETQSEMALPLKVGGKVVGALDVQSTETSAISNDDIASLSVLADQVSVAIENARLYEETRKSLEQTESAYSQYVQSEWAKFMRAEKLAGYQFSAGASRPLDAPLDLGEAARVVAEGKIMQSDAETGEAQAQLAVPIRLRGKVVGIMHIGLPEKYRWSEDEIDIAEAAAERLALSIENARLFYATAGRAARERVVSEISTRISGNIRMENILRTAAQELSQALDGSEVLIQLMKRESPAEVQE